MFMESLTMTEINNCSIFINLQFTIFYIKLVYIVVGGNTLKFCSTQIMASLQTKVPAHPTSTRHCRRPEMPSLLGLSHAF